MMFSSQKSVHAAQPRSKPVCNETSAGITQRHHVDTTATPRWYFNCSAYPQCTTDPKLRFGCRLRHDGMNFRTSPDPLESRTPPLSACYVIDSRRSRPLCALRQLQPEQSEWNLRGATSGTLSMSAFWQRRSSTTLGCGHWVYQLHPAQSPPTALSRKHPISTHSTRVSHDSRAQVEARLSPISSFSHLI